MYEPNLSPVVIRTTTTEGTFNLTLPVRFSLCNKPPPDYSSPETQGDMLQTAYWFLLRQVEKDTRAREQWRVHWLDSQVPGQKEVWKVNICLKVSVNSRGEQRSDFLRCVLQHKSTNVEGKDEKG